MLIDVPKRLPKRIGLAGGDFSNAQAAPTPASPGKPSRKGQEAGTLIEVIIATVILAIAGAGIVGSINYGMFMMQLARENARATQVMVEKLESIRLYNWSEVISNGFVPTSFTDVYDPQAPTNQQGAVYNGTMTVDSIPFSATYGTNMRKFTVTLQWTTAGRIAHTRSLTTYVARDGIQNYVY